MRYLEFHQIWNSFNLATSQINGKSYLVFILMIINKYFSKSTLYPGVKCNICDDLIGKGSRQEFYNVVEVVGDKQILRYAGMSKEF